MTDFFVKYVTDGDTFKVDPAWVFKNKSDDIVRPTGYDTPEKGESGYEEAKQKLTDLILNKTLDIKDYIIIDEWGTWYDNKYATKALSPRAFTVLPIINRAIKQKANPVNVIETENNSG